MYYLKIIDTKGDIAIIECDSFSDALNTRNAFVNYDANLKISIEIKEQYFFDNILGLYSRILSG